MSFWHSGPNHQFAGQSILLADNFPGKTQNMQKGESGRILSIVFNIDKQSFQIINVYGPNKPNKQEHFYQSLTNYITNVSNIIVGGDVNMVENLKDRLGGSICNTHLAGSNALTKLIKNLHETWQKINPNKSEFTYHQMQSNVHSRLDRIYANKNIQIRTSRIIPLQYPDHEAMLIEFILGTRHRSPGYWKLNTSILLHANFQKAFKNFWTNWQEQKQSYNQLSTWWEAGKLYLKMLAARYCVELQKNIRNKHKQLTQLLKSEKLKPNPDQNQINNIHIYLQDIQNYKNTGSIIRSNEKLITEQEKPNRFFFDQEKQKQNKTIKQLKKIQNNETEILTNDFEILKFCQNVFAELYTKIQTNVQIQEELLTPIQIKISNIDNEKLTQKITLK